MMNDAANDKGYSPAYLSLERCSEGSSTMTASLPADFSMSSRTLAMLVLPLEGWPHITRRGMVGCLALSSIVCTINCKRLE